MDVVAAVAKAYVKGRKLQEALPYEASLIEFTEYVWPVVEPAIPFVRGWAIDAIAEHLEAVTNGQIRRLLINVSPGFTKPIRKDQLVQTLRGLMPLSDVVVGDRILTHKGRFRRVAAIHEQGVLPIVKVETWCGRKVYSAPDHPFLTTRSWIAAKDLMKGDYLAAVSVREDFGNEIDPKEARFLGYLIGDGSVKYAGITFCNAEVDVLADFHACAAALGFSTRSSVKAGNKALTVHLSSNRDGSLQRWLKRHDLKGKDSYTKRVPEAIIHGTRDSIAHFLGAYWSCDGYVAIRHSGNYNGKKTAYLAKLTTVSKGLAEDVQLLALRLGINLRLRKRVAKLQSKRQGRLYVSYDLEATNQHEIAKIKMLPGLCVRKREAIMGAVPTRFEEHLLPDPFLSLSDEEPAECRCLTVEEDSSFVVNGLAVHNSLLTDVMWPAWEWGPRNMPWMRYMCASYSNHLTERDNMRCRNIVISDRYRRLWGNRFRISNEQFTKVKFANDRTGWKLATSVAGIGTGERADKVIIDDPNNPMEMESEAIRANINMWFTEVIPDRLNNQAESAIVVIQQRTHEDDVSGTALSREMGYTHLMIPMRHDTSRHCTTVLGYNPITDEEIVWEDPRTEDGELAWPERFSPEIVDELERDKGPHAFAGQYQQSPEPRGGSILKRHYWQLWKEPKFPTFELILGSLDTAYTAKEENDASALTVWGMFRDENKNPKIMLIWAWQGRLEFHDLFQHVINVCTMSNERKETPQFPVDRLLVEAKASGMSIGQELYRMFRGSGRLGIDLINPAIYGDKVARVGSIEHIFADGMVYAPDKEWADMVINQCAVFPKGSRDDLVDSTSQAIRFLRESGFALRRDEYATESAEELLYKGSLRPLYVC